MLRGKPARKVVRDGVLLVLIAVLVALLSAVVLIETTEPLLVA